MPIPRRRPPNSVNGWRQTGIARCLRPWPGRPKAARLGWKTPQKDQLQDLPVGSAVRPCPPPFRGDEIHPEVDQTNLHSSSRCHGTGADRAHALCMPRSFRANWLRGLLVARPRWWSQTGSNRRPPACKAGALPTELWPLQVSGIRSGVRYLILDT